MDRHVQLTTSQPAGGGGMTAQEHAAQLSAVRASLLIDSARVTRRDVDPLRAAETVAGTAVSSPGAAGLGTAG